VGYSDSHLLGFQLHKILFSHHFLLIVMALIIGSRVAVAQYDLNGDALDELY